MFPVILGFGKEGFLYIQGEPNAQSKGRQRAQHVGVPLTAELGR